MPPVTVDIADCGDAAFLAVATGGDPEERWRTVHRLAERLERRGLDGVLGLIPTYESVLVEFDATVIGHVALRAAIEAAATQAAAPIAATEPREFTVPVVYGGAYGPDLADTAAGLGLTEAELVAAHHRQPLTIRCLGAPCGATLTDGPSLPGPVPRLPAPRVAVPPGTVALAGRQGNIYPMTMPGGWRLIGRTPLRLADLDADPPTPCRPGDLLRFVPIDAADWSAHEGLPLGGRRG